MKKLLLLSFLFLQLFSFAQNNKYIPFPSKMISYGSIHHVRADYDFYSVYRIEINGDTTINGIKYSKYYSAEKFPDNKYTQVNPNTSGTYAKLAGGIRNDLATKKVYLYSLSTNKEELLYDFDLKVGDTIFKDEGYRSYHSLLSQESLIKIDTVWVSRIDSVLMPHDGLYHKRFNFNAFARFGKKELISSDTITSTQYFSIKMDPLIEGVGMEYNPLRSYYIFENGMQLYPQCISIDGKTVYSFPYVPPPFIKSDLCNSVITGVKEYRNNSVITLYPNPSNGKFELITHDLNNSYFEISNILGTTLLKSKIEKDEMEIDFLSQAAGIYFIRTYGPTGLIATKKIVIN